MQHSQFAVATITITKKKDRSILHNINPAQDHQRPGKTLVSSNQLPVKGHLAIVFDSCPIQIMQCFELSSSEQKEASSASMDMFIMS
jgi:hypothetical protein